MKMNRWRQSGEGFPRDEQKDHPTRMRRGINIVADTIRTSFSGIPDIGFVSFKKIGKMEYLSELRMSQRNSAFYVGKFFKHDWKKRIKEIIGKNDEHLYTPQFMEAILLFMFQNLPYGERANIVIGRSLSEIFNSPEDIETSLSVEETKRMIRDIAKKRLQVPPERLHIEEMEEQQENKRLFAALRNPKNAQENGRVNIEKVFLSDEGEKDDEEIDSYTIARILYRAMQKSPVIFGMIRATVPNYKHKSEEEVEQMQYYGMAEIAIRLMAILKGVYIHGGAERQEVYDEIIVKIVRGQSIITKNIPELNDLINIYRKKHKVHAEEKLRFETLHVDNKVNKPLLEHERLIARIRMAMGILLIGAITIPVTIGVKKRINFQQEEQQRGVYKQLAPEVKEGYSQVDHWETSNVMRPEQLKEIVDKVQHVLMVRYGFSQHNATELRGNIIDFMRCHRTDDVDRLGSSVGKYVEMSVDRFIEDNKGHLLNKGIKADMPYPAFESYRQIFLDTVSSQDHMQIGPECIMLNGKRDGPRVTEYSHHQFSCSGIYGGNPEFLIEYIGNIFDSENIYVEYECFIVRIPQGTYIVAREKDSDQPPSTEIAQKAIKSYMTSIRIHTFLPLMKYFGCFPLTPILPQYNFTIDPKDDHLSSIDQYRDPFTGEIFEITFYCTGNESYEKHVVVRKQGEQYFTSEAALQLHVLLGLSSGSRPM
jgi:hypothetical protein